VSSTSSSRRDEARAFVAVERHLAPLLRRDDLLLDVIAERVAYRFLFGLSDEHLPSGPYQAGIW